MAASETSIATEATRTAAAQNSADYTGGIAAHVAGDYGKHNQFNYIAQGGYPITISPADAPHGPHSINIGKLRTLLTNHNGNNFAVIIPAWNGGTFTSNGTWSGSPYAVAPVFSLQPAGGEYTLDSTFVLAVEVSGTPPILLQWQKNGLAITGATSNNLFFTNFQEGDAGDYTCIATNANGQTISAVAVIAMRTSAISTVPTRST